MEESYNIMQEENKNASNSLAWSGSRQYGLEMGIDIPRSTAQAFILIIYDTQESTHGKFENTIIGLRSVLNSYGHGEFFGKAVESSLDCIEGYWCPRYNLGCLCFDSEFEAQKCVEAKTELREWYWLGGVEMYIVPNCSPVKSCHNYPIFQFDLYDIKNRKNFTDYMKTVVPLVTKYKGIVIAGTEQVGKWRGVRKPNYIFIAQWTRKEDFMAYNDQAHVLLRDAGAACASRILFQMKPMNMW